MDINRVLTSLRATKSVRDQLSEKLKNLYLLDGKTMAEWEEHFHVGVTSDMDLTQCKMALCRVAELYQEVSVLKRRAQFEKKVLDKTLSIQFSSKFMELYTERKNEKAGSRPPGKDIVEHETTSEMREDYGVAIHTEVIYSFFTEIERSLVETRKQLEDIQMNLGIEAKILRRDEQVEGELQ